MDWTLLNEFVFGPEGMNLAFLNFLAMAAPFIAKGVGKVFGAGGKAAAQNRGEKLDANLMRDQIATSRGQLDLGQQEENRTERDDAWKMLQRLAYTRSQAAPMQRPEYIPEAFYNPNAVRRTSPMELQGGEGLERELMARLQNGPRQMSLPPLTDVNQMTKRSGFEKLADIISPAASGYGEFMDIFGRNKRTEDDDPWRE